jgi:hypothetical protein
MTLSEGQRIALENLARKRAGQDVDWISIADARALTDLGLAERTRAGWVITDAGLAVVKPAADDRDDHANDRPTPLRP